jgi:hypothetical protein
VTETPTNVTTPPDLTYGYVDGRIILAIGDRSDAGRMPDPVPADGMTVTFTPANTILKVASPTPATVIKQPIVRSVDANGYLIDGQAARGVWLVTGTYKVTYSHPRAMIPSHDIEVTTGHTEAAPLDLTTAMPPGGPVLTPSEYAELNGRLTILEAGGGGGVTDHGALTGLGDDDHGLYALADGTRGAFAAPLGADDNYVTDAEKAALHAHSNKAALDLVSGTNTGDQVLPTWSTISGKPAVVAEGATQAAARTALSLGDAATKNTGTTAGTVAAGDDSRIGKIGGTVTVSGTPTAGQVPIASSGTAAAWGTPESIRRGPGASTAAYVNINGRTGGNMSASAGNRVVSHYNPETFTCDEIGLLQRSGNTSATYRLSIWSGYPNPSLVFATPEFSAPTTGEGSLTFTVPPGTVFPRGVWYIALVLTSGTSGIFCSGGRDSAFEPNRDPNNAGAAEVSNFGVVGPGWVPPAALTLSSSWASGSLPQLLAKELRLV